ncbi:baseplate wedge component [Cyanophage S-RIM12]|uniref:Baseplate wedge component n=1 Tax=Cyanophage S-RIM12 TaxID=1278402 RepID=A0A1D7SV70_9CAUD|nr:baseplate wedge component [Cyanophage S-RIM12]
MASYFSNFPNVYVGEGITSNEGFKYRLTKNISRRVKVRDDLDQYVTSFEAYSIQDGESPSFLANAIFGDPFLDWIILLSNNITDFYTQWPKSEENLQAFVRDAYTDPDAIHHYETNEILYEDIVYIKEGSSVTDGFRVVMPDGSVKTAEESRYPVSNYEYEHYLNEQKRLIGIPNGVMVDLMQEEMRSLLEYESNPEVDKFGNKKTPMSMASRFITNDTSVTGSGSRTSIINDAVTSFDNGPSASGTTLAGVSTSTTAATTTTATATTTATSSSSSSSSSGSSGGGYGGY